MNGSKPGLRLEREMVVERPLEEVFAFFADPLNLERITPPWLRFRVLGEPDAPLRAGSTIDYRLRVHGVPLSWTSLISHWEPPYAFVDEQVRGPYRLWVHRHTFEPLDGDPAGATRVRDAVDYAVPGGRLVDRLLVRRDLERIFAYRRERLAELLRPAEARKSAG